MTSEPSQPAFRAARKVRDLVTWDDGHGGSYVVACDANAGVGGRPADVLPWPPEDAGYSAAKVPLMEVLAAGAEPIVAANTLSMPLEGYGQRIVNGIRRAMDDAGCGHVVLTGSDETNMPTTQSGIGVTVIGFAGARQLLVGNAGAGDVVVCAGLPRDGLRFPYRDTDSSVAGPSDVRRLRDSALVHELLPVGSRGVRYEVGQLAHVAGLHARFRDHRVSGQAAEIDLDVSAGGSTCILLACDPDRVQQLATMTTLKLTEIASLEPRR